MREMTVYGVSFDLVGKQPIVLLRTQDGNTFLPIWIGHPEAAAILMNLQGTESQRPMTHDLAAAIVASLDAEIRKVTVTELRENTFHARITLVRNGTEIELDARTSDAIALALRADAKIFAVDEVIEESGVEFEGDEEEASRRLMGQDSLADLDPDEFRRFLDTVSPDEFAEPEEEP
jgi:bifunctional DNase/RNase